MNRPKATDYMKENGSILLGPESFIDTKKYACALEEYCDALEKALDKACSRIVEYEVLQGGYMEKDAVKEWALKDEQSN